MLHHCQKCWDGFHNGRIDNDYVEPAYYGQPMSEKADEAMMKEFGTIFIRRTIVADKKRIYKEGEYH
jgi:hypothetical protein